MKRSLLVLLVVFTTTLFFIAGQAVQGSDTTLRAAGCKTEYFLFKDLAQDYHKQTGGKLLPAGTGNKKAVKLLMEKKVDFAFTCKPIGKIQKGLKLDPADVAGWKSIPLAKDPIVIVSNSQNGVEKLTMEQLTQLFAGNISNWKELGGKDLPVKLSYLNPKLESGVSLLFKEFTVGNKGQLAQNARHGDGPSMLGNYTSLTPGAITFMGFNSYKEKYGEILEIDGAMPTRESILDGSYKLAATYYLTKDVRKLPALDKFLGYVESNAGKEAIEMNFISITK